MPARASVGGSQQAIKSPKNPNAIMKQEKTTPKKKKQTVTTPAKTSSTATSTTPTIKKSEKTPKSSTKAAASSSSSALTTTATSSSKVFLDKPSSARRRKTPSLADQEKKQLIKKESIRKTAKISGCSRIGGDVYEKARIIFDQMLGDLLKRAALLTLHRKHKKITHQDVNQSAKGLWNINVYNGISADDVKMCMVNDSDDPDYGSNTRGGGSSSSESESD